MVFQHVAHEPLGTLDPMLKAAGFRIRYINFGREPDTIPKLDSYSGLIVLGGPMGVYEAAQIPHLQVEMKLIEEALKKNIPVLGICLGAQLLAGVLGAEVKKAKQWEFGWHNIEVTETGKKDPLFSHYNSSEKVFQLHQDTFALPTSAQHLVRSALYEGQAFSYNERAYGLQFHLEADHAMILRWLKRPEHKRLSEHLKVSEDQLEKDAAQFIQRSLELSQLTFSKFIEIFKLPPRQEALGSSHGKPKKWYE